MGRWVRGEVADLESFMPLRDLNDAKHWRDRAAEMRALAESTKDAAAARTVLNLAEVYEKLAAQAEARAKSGFDFFSVPSPLRSKVPRPKE
jgi:hypothetical protein